MRGGARDFGDKNKTPWPKSFRKFLNSRGVNLAGHFADVLSAEELSIVQVAEIELSQEQVDKLERR